MSISVYFKQFDEEKVNKAWDGIANGEFIETLDKEKQKIEKKLERFKGMDLTLTDDDLYNPTTDKDEVKKKEELITERRKLERLSADLSEMLDSAEGLKDLSKTESLNELSFEISSLDEQLMDYFIADKIRGKYSEYYSTVWGDFLLLFKEVLKVNLSEVYKDELGEIPQEVWEKFYKTISKDHLIAIKDQIEGEVSYIIEIVQSVRDVLKQAIDTNTRFVVYTEQDLMLQEPFKSRLEKIYQKLK